MRVWEQGRRPCIWHAGEVKLSAPAQASPLTGLLAASAALVAALAGMIIACAVMALAAASGQTAGWQWGAVVRDGAIAWVVANGAPVHIGMVWYSLLPWGLVAIPVAVLMWLGCVVAKRARVVTWWDRATAIAAAGMTYAICVTAISMVASTSAVGTRTPRAAVLGGLISILAFGWGIVRVSRRAAPLGLPPRAQAVLRAIRVMVSGLIFLGSLVTVVTLIANNSIARGIESALSPGLLGGLVLLVVQLGYLPVLITWSIAFSLGTPVAIGSGSVISPFLAHPAPSALPALPVLAAVPSGSTGLAWILPIVVIGIGAAAGVHLARTFAGPAPIRAVLALIASAGTGVVVAVAAWLSHGSLGNRTLHQLGPNALWCFAASFALLTVGSVVMSACAAQRFTGGALSAHRPDASRARESSIRPQTGGEVTTPAWLQPVDQESPAVGQVPMASSGLDQTGTQVISLPETHIPDHQLPPNEDIHE